MGPAAAGRGRGGEDLGAVVVRLGLGGGREEGAGASTAGEEVHRRRRW